MPIARRRGMKGCITGGPSATATIATASIEICLHLPRTKREGLPNPVPTAPAAPPATGQSCHSGLTKTFANSAVAMHACSLYPLVTCSVLVTRSPPTVPTRRKAPARREGLPRDLGFYGGLKVQRSACAASSSRSSLTMVSTSALPSAARSASGRRTCSLTPRRVGA